MRRGTFAVAILAIFYVLLPSALFAQEVDHANLPIIDYKRPRDMVIKDITVSGVKYLDQQILVNLSGLRVGQKISVPGEDITRAIEKLWGQGLFSDVKITTTEIKSDSITFDIYLQERARLSKFEIFGLKESKQKELREQLELKRGKQVTENILNNTKRLIYNYLYDKKFLNAEVNIVQVDDTLSPANNVILKVYIDKKKKVKIKDIVFTGNDVIKSRKLRRKMKNTHRRDFNIFKGSKFLESDYNTDKDAVLAEYRKNGYRDAEIVKDTVYKISEKRLMIEIDLTEGNQYFFRDIDWVGNTKYNVDFLTHVLGVESGDPYNLELLNERLSVDEDAVSSLYLDEGYLFFNINPAITKIDGDSIDIQMRMFEGDQVTLNRVIIRGNTQTNEHVVRRELRTRPGDLFSRSDIIRSQRELANLGHFDPEQFGIEPININQAEGTVDLEYSLVERHNDQLEISGGWGNNMFVGTLGLRFSNFSLKNILKLKEWRPVPSGDGQTLSLRLQSNGSYYKAYSLSFVEPWLGGKKPNAFSLSAYRTIQDNSEYFWSVSDSYFRITGVSVGLTRRVKWPDDFFILSHSIAYQNYKLRDYNTYSFILKNGTANNFTLSTTLSRNSVDQLIYPRSGSSISLSVELTPPYSLFKDNKWWELSDQDILNIQDGVIAEYNSPDSAQWWDDKYDLTTPEAINYFLNGAYASKEADEINQRKYNWIEYHKWKFKGEWYLKLWDDLVLATNVQFGYLGHYDKDLGPSPFGGFRMGGDGLSGYNLYGSETIGLRGYANYALTPGDPMNVYEKLFFELRYPITLKPQASIYVLGFVEGGNAWYSIDEYNPFNIKRSAGIGLRAFLPMFGMLGVDWGYGFDNVYLINGDLNSGGSGSQFHFVLGQQF